MTRSFIQVAALKLSARYRRRRFVLFKALVSSLPRPLRILDVGGEEKFWERMEFVEEPGVTIVLFNIKDVKVSRPNFRFVLGDGRNMTAFRDGEFDVVFSNSVLEHLGEFTQQRRMADEVKRVGKRYFLQTPNRHFPLEPHFLFPFFQFLPIRAKVFLLSRFNLGWYARTADVLQGERIVTEIRLLTAAELRVLFPGAQIWRERFLALTKSFVVIQGWEVGSGLQQGPQ